MFKPIVSGESKTNVYAPAKEVKNHVPALGKVHTIQGSTLNPSQINSSTFPGIRSRLFWQKRIDSCQIRSGDGHGHCAYLLRRSYGLSGALPGEQLLHGLGTHSVNSLTLPDGTDMIGLVPSVCGV